MRFIDISLPIHPDLPVWPGDPKVVVERIRTQANGFNSNDSRLSCSVHTGTHVDAPRHFIEGGAPVEQLPLDVLLGPAEVVEIRDKNSITADHLESLSLPAATQRLLIKTRNSELWDNPGHTFHTDFVALEPPAARWIANRGIRLVGIDYLSVQRFRDKDPTTHRLLLEAGVVIVEGLDLRHVEPGRYRLVCLPLKLSGCDGAPARTILIQE